MHDKVFGLKLIRFLLCGLFLVQIGCATMSSGIADIKTAINADKQLEEKVDVSALAAYEATIAALTELNMSITGQYQDGTSVGIKSKSDSDTVWIEITSISTVSCMVAVRVGVFANESPRARAILSAILKNLPNASTASEMQPIQDNNLKQTDNFTTDTLQQTLQNENDTSSADTPSEELKPLPQEIVTEKSLL
jgi:hypothetical protein